MLSDQEKEKIKQLIIKKIENAIEEIAELEDLTKPIPPENAIGRISRMDAINNRSVNEAALRQKKEQLVNLQMALSNINSSGFGTCVRCGNEIPTGRLFVMPESTRCVKCY